MSDVDAAINALIYSANVVAVRRLHAHEHKTLTAEESLLLGERDLKANHSALRALLTPTITDSDVEAAAMALAGVSSWTGLPTHVKHIVMSDAKACLEAVAAARQRATGSGVTK